PATGLAHLPPHSVHHGGDRGGGVAALADRQGGECGALAGAGGGDEPSGVGTRIRMKAIVQNGYGSPDVLELREGDPPAAADEVVLVKVRAASINAADGFLLRRPAHVIARLLGRPVPRIRGVDMAGVVEACGRHASRFKAGDEVFGVARGTFAEYATTTEARLALKPRLITFEQAATLPVAGCTALQGLRDKALVRAGQRVLIYGAGGG